MSDVTKIEWATATWNPWEGCTKVSDGCKHCYAEVRNHRFGMDNWGPGKPRRRTSEANWKKPLAWNRAAEWNERDAEACGREPVPRPRIFPSLCDWLDDEVPAEFLGDFLSLIFNTQSLDWLLLTKRPENFWPLINRSTEPDEPFTTAYEWSIGDAPENVWLGTSVENRKTKHRIDELRKLPARIRFLSLEPLLEDLGDLDLAGIHWVIVGGESGREARPCDISWIRNIVGQCRAAGVPCFVKQIGDAAFEKDQEHETRPYPSNRPKGGDPSEWPDDLRVREFPIK